MSSLIKSQKTNSMILWADDDQLFQLIRQELYTAVVGDIMDQLGRYHQFLPPEITPLRDDMIIVGRAMPVLEADTPNQPSKVGESSVTHPFGLMLEALDDLKKNEVYICTGSSLDYALWGELMSIRAMKLGAAGAVLNGYSRDTRGILQLGFPTFSYGRYAQDQAPRGKVTAFRVPIELGGVHVDPGDIIMGDMDGVCVIPQAIEDDVFTKALEKARGEKTVSQALLSGMGASAAFKRYQIM